MTRVFERQMFIASPDRIGLPGPEVRPQRIVDPGQVPRRKRKHPNAREVFQTGERVELGPIAIEGRSFLSTTQFFDRTLAILNSGLDDQLRVLIQLLRNREQVVSNLGFKLPADTANMREGSKILLPEPIFYRAIYH
jgi:hypothetical protein